MAAPTVVAVDPSESTAVTAALNSLTPKTAKGDTRPWTMKGVCTAYLNLVDVMIDPPSRTPTPTPTPTPTCRRPRDTTKAVAVMPTMAFSMVVVVLKVH